VKGAQLRAYCAQALFDILEQGQSARAVLPRYQNKLQGKDKAWLQHTVYGILRALPQYQFWVRNSLDKPLKGNKKVLEHLLMVGFYQLFAMRVADHAAVGATVAACDKLQGRGLKGLVNAVLRRFIRDDLAQQRVTGEAAQAGLPGWLYKACQTHYPAQLDELLGAMNDSAPLWLRINPAHISVSDYRALLTEANINSSIETLLPDAICIEQLVHVPDLPGFAQGWFAVQDGAAQLAAAILAPKAGETGLDCCAAPGGKTAHLLATQPKLAQLTALDSDSARLARVAENLARLGHQAQLRCADAATVIDYMTSPCDFILCDVPCSATGVIRRHPDIRWLRKASDIAPLVATQKAILENMWLSLKPGGRLLYATCSILPAENSEQIRAFLASHEDAALVPIPADIEAHFAYQAPASASDDARLGLQILPNTAQCDGFYYALLQKRA
jgi:16S rRNA (cytosine967-C5)-methyltransferase